MTHAEKISRFMYTNKISALCLCSVANYTNKNSPNICLVLFTAADETLSNFQTTLCGLCHLMFKMLY